MFNWLSSYLACKYELGLEGFASALYSKTSAFPPCSLPSIQIQLSVRRRQRHNNWSCWSLWTLRKWRRDHKICQDTGLLLELRWMWMPAKSHCESNTRSYIIRALGIFLNVSVFRGRGYVKFYVHLILRVLLHLVALGACKTVIWWRTLERCQLVVHWRSVGGPIMTEAPFIMVMGMGLFTFVYCCVQFHIIRGEGHSLSRYNGICKDL